jgi:hypothetical protein
VLTRSNYHELGLWDAVVSGSVDRREDRLVLATIFRVLLPEMKVRLAMKMSVKEVWEAVKSKRVGDNCVKSADV